ncbi:hypothetical protein [Microvirga sp. P5_D2]
MNALALVLAIQALEALQYLQLDDIQVMRALLWDSYPRYAVVLGAKEWV